MDDNIGDTLNTVEKHSDEADKIQIETSARPLKMNKRRAKDPLGGDEWVRPTKKALYCICQKPNNKSKAMLECDLCGGWYHMTCVGVSPTRDVSSLTYACLSTTCTHEKLKQGVLYTEKNSHVPLPSKKPVALHHEEVVHNIAVDEQHVVEIAATP